VDLSYYRSDTKLGVGCRLNKKGPHRPNVTKMSLLEAAIEQDVTVSTVKFS
jgi:hypothetical protein